MAGRLLNTDAIVLLRQPPKDSFQGCTLFSPEHGLLNTQFRLPRKTSTTPPPPDLFDEISATLEEGKLRGWFVKEFRIQLRHEGIARGYDRLLAASDLARAIMRNLIPDDSRPVVFARLQQALTAFERSNLPYVVYLKSLYSIARDEGHPVHGHWLMSLPKKQQADASRLLHTSLAELEEQPPKKDSIQRLRESLEMFLQQHADMHLR